MRKRKDYPEHPDTLKCRSRGTLRHGKKRLSFWTRRVPGPSAGGRTEPVMCPASGGFTAECDPWSLRPNARSWQTILKD